MRRAWLPGIGTVVAGAILASAGCSILDPQTTGTGSLQITVIGAPLPPAITVTGSAGYYQIVSGDTTLSSLAAGRYAVTAGHVIVGTSIYLPTSDVQMTTVRSSMNPGTVTFTYVRSKYTCPDVGLIPCRGSIH